ncbi:MAG: methyltransferase domain-containing protein, partial [Chitinophagaceae bacterium]|nr:methyltransferase domain-containing protein [Chitinophagaceae bacterium]
MRKKDWYENWFCSAYYNLLYEERDELEAAAFIDALLKHLQPEQGSRMLDIACGEGRFAKKLAERDYNVTGIDLSHASIQNAKQHETDNLHFYVHDMRLPFYFNYFDYAFNFFTSFGYFGKERDHMMAAASFGKSLKKGGILVVDYFNTQYVIDHLVEKETVNKNDHEFQITRNVTDGYIVKDIR